MLFLFFLVFLQILKMLVIEQVTNIKLIVQKCTVHLCCAERSNHKRTTQVDSYILIKKVSPSGHYHLFSRKRNKTRKHKKQSEAKQLK